jgi:hypothetical protein
MIFKPCFDFISRMPIAQIFLRGMQNKKSVMHEGCGQNGIHPNANEVSWRRRLTLTRALPNGICVWLIAHATHCAPIPFPSRIASGPLSRTPRALSDV